MNIVSSVDLCLNTCFALLRKAHITTKLNKNLDGCFSIENWHKSTHIWLAIFDSHTIYCSRDMRNCSCAVLCFAYFKQKCLTLHTPREQNYGADWQLIVQASSHSLALLNNHVTEVTLLTLDVKWQYALVTLTAYLPHTIQFIRSMITSTVKSKGVKVLTNLDK